MAADGCLGGQVSRYGIVDFQYGIDIPDLSLMAPHQVVGEPEVRVVCRTVLFHRVYMLDTWFLYLKPEPNGLGTMIDAARHLQDFLMPYDDCGIKRKERVWTLEVCRAMLTSYS